MSTATAWLHDNDKVAPVLPGDDAGIERVEQWLQAFAVSRDPTLREQIVLAYLGWPTGWPTATAPAAGPPATT
jgi:hypothetical protein